MAMTSGKPSLIFFVIGFKCGFRAGLWDFSPKSLLKRLETVLEPIAVPSKHKIKRIFLQELFCERITVSLSGLSYCSLFSVDEQIFSCHETY